MKLKILRQVLHLFEKSGKIQQYFIDAKISKFRNEGISFVQIVSKKLKQLGIMSYRTKITRITKITSVEN